MFYAKRMQGSSLIVITLPLYVVHRAAALQKNSNINYNRVHVHDSLVQNATEATTVVGGHEGQFWPTTFFKHFFDSKEDKDLPNNDVSSGETTKMEEQPAAAPPPTPQGNASADAAIAPANPMPEANATVSPATPATATTGNSSVTSAQVGTPTTKAAPCSTPKAAPNATRQAPALKKNSSLPKDKFMAPQSQKKLDTMEQHNGTQATSDKGNSENLRTNVAKPAQTNDERLQVPEDPEPDEAFAVLDMASWNCNQKCSGGGCCQRADCELLCKNSASYRDICQSFEWQDSTLTCALYAVQVEPSEAASPANDSGKAGAVPAPRLAGNSKSSAAKAVANTTLPKVAPSVAASPANNSGKVGSSSTAVGAKAGAVPALRSASYSKSGAAKAVANVTVPKAAPSAAVPLANSSGKVGASNVTVGPKAAAATVALPPVKAQSHANATASTQAAAATVALPPVKAQSTENGTASTQAVVKQFEATNSTVGFVNRSSNNISVHGMPATQLNLDMNRFPSSSGKPLQPRIFIAIFSRFAAFAQRGFIREMWHHAEIQSGGDATVKFAICRNDGDLRHANEVEVEHKMFDDLLMLDCEEGYGEGRLTLKVIAAMEAFIKNYPDKSLFMKVDDDSFVAWKRFSKLLLGVKKGTYMGTLIGKSVPCRNASYRWFEPYTTFPGSFFPASMAGGPGYVLSRDLVEQIIDQNISRSNVLWNEDRAVGVWVNELKRQGVEVEFVQVRGISGWWSWDWKNPTSTWKTWGEYPYVTHHELHGETINCLAKADMHGDPQTVINQCFEPEVGENHEVLQCAAETLREIKANSSAEALAEATKTELLDQISGS